MGIRGLTTFIAKHSDKYFQSYELHDTYLVVDGNNLAMQLYKWHCKCYDCFGGDYDKYAFKVRQMFKLFADCNVTPLIIFDGGYENRKLKTHYDRMSAKIYNAGKLTSATEGSLRVVRCDFEADTEMASVARALNCPLLSYDSDFYVSDVLYIPFSTLELKICSKEKYSYIPCEIYIVEAFLKTFGLDKSLLPLIGVLLGNDYVQLSKFRAVFSQMKMQKKKFTQSCTQRRICGVMKWLQDETYDSAVKKILSRCKQNCREHISQQIVMAQQGYIATESKLLKYLNVCTQEIVSHNLTKQDLPIPDVDIKDELNSDDCNEFDIEITFDNTDLDESEKLITQTIPTWFLDKYRKCLYPSVFMDFIIKNRYFASPQVEDYSNKHADRVSHNIIAAIHTILISGERETVDFVARSMNNNFTTYVIDKSMKNLPKLDELTNLTKEQSKEVLIDVLNIDNKNILIMLPETWHIYILGIEYWTKNATPSVTKAHLYAVILCLLVINVVDKKIGVHRSIKKYLEYYEKNLQKLDCNSNSNIDNHNNVITSLKNITEKDSLACMKELISYFHMDAKLMKNHKLFNINIIDCFAQFQSCLLHISYLNNLLNNPFENVLISDFYNGTFLYNACYNFLKRSDLDNYMKLLLGNSPNILNSFNSLVSLTNAQNSVVASLQGTKRKRRRKKKKLVEDEQPECPENEEDDEDILVDENNRFSLLHLA